LKEENILLKATVTESDKSREIIIRELSYMKELEGERLKETEKKKEAELKMLEKVIDNMKKEKKELELRLYDMRDKVERVKEKYTHEYH
jgi:hypothetical protein